MIPTDRLRAELDSARRTAGALSHGDGARDLRACIAKIEARLLRTERPIYDRQVR